SSSGNSIYNNLFNNTDNFGFTGTTYTNTWNITKVSGTNIVGKSYIGGNYWGKPDASGNSDTCWDTTGDYICESSETLATGNTDYLPLTQKSDSTDPNIYFDSPTPDDNDYINENYTYINVTATDTNNITAFIDWNNSLVGWWRFNQESGENNTFFRDWSNWGNNGTNSSTPTYTSGQFGQALQFDGVDDYVSVPDSISLNIIDAVTLEVWIKPAMYGWTKKKSITVNGSDDSDLTNYQIKVDLDYDSDMQTDFDDLRFYDATGTLQNHWIEKYTASTNATVWVKISSIPTGGTTIYMYYGNSIATYNNSLGGNNTFEFFDDFNDNSIDTAKWNTFGSLEETEGELNLSITSVKEWVSSKPSLPVNSSVRFRSNIMDSGIVEAGFLKDIETRSGLGGDGNYYNMFNGPEYVRSYSGGSAKSTVVSFSDSYHVFEIKKTNDEARFYKDNSLDATHTTHIPDGSIPIGLFAYGFTGTTATMYVDWIAILKYTPTEPSVLSVGTETSVAVSKTDAYGVGANTTTAFALINNQTINASISSGWNYIVVTYDKDLGSDQQKLYVNGKLKTQGTLTDTININQNNFHIGDYFNCTIDEVKIWNRALTAEEINASYNAGLYRLETNITDLTDGTYTYTAYAQDLAGNTNQTGTRTLTIDTIEPTSDHPNDADYAPNSDATINWKLTDNHGAGYYYITRNGTIQNTSTQWTNNTQISVWVNTSTTGFYNYTIHFNDSSGNDGIPDNVFINIATTFSITLNTPPNQMIRNNATPDFNFTVSGSELSYVCELFINNSGYGTSEYFTNIGHIDTSGFGRGVWGDGTDIYLADFQGGLKSFTFNGTDFTNTDHVDYGGFGMNVLGDGTYIYLANAVGGLRAFTFNGTDFTNTSYIYDGGYAYEVWGDENYLYLANGIDGLRVYTFNGTDFTNTGYINTSEDGRGVWGDGTYIYLANYYDGLRAYTFNGTNFTNTGHIDNGGRGVGVWGDGTYIYLANRLDGLRAYTFNGTNFTNIGHINPDGGPELDVWGDGTYIYLANQAAGLRVFTFNGTDFTNIDHIDNGGTGTGVWGDGTYIYLANYDDGLRAYSFNALNNTQTIITANHTLSDGNYNWHVNCTAGGTTNQSETREIIIDATNPSIQYNPTTTTAGNYSRNWLFINITASDTNKDTVLFEWNGTNETFDNNNGNIYWENKTGLS
ncbi:MAG: DUF2341 domain-containing protein, partial [Nanohaloarchaea archaeon]|nr:DUF2341 domain-containing protein [Candidatus Nanohaloarchaea archaeon]